MIPRPGHFAALLLAACLAGGGCRLARPEAAAATIPDRQVATPTATPAPPSTPVTETGQGPPRLADLPAEAAGDLVRYGQAIVENTPGALQEAARREGKRAASVRLSCRHCHIGGGTRESAFPWFGLSGAYPRYEPRAGRVVQLAEQVNACLTRCLNAPPLAAESREMRAILAYIAALPAATDRHPAPAFPDRPADLVAGEEVYRDFCRSCHGADGAGRPDVPPLWGVESYATGASLHRVTTAAGFIRSQMPPPGERLSMADAFDVAAYVNSFARPHTADLHLDYPALTEKPVDCPYPPYPDRFPAYRHKYGPFAEIAAAAKASGTVESGR